LEESVDKVARQMLRMFKNKLLRSIIRVNSWEITGGTASVV
jgi:hypothetical protein